MGQVQPFAHLAQARPALIVAYCLTTYTAAQDVPRFAQFLSVRHIALLVLAGSASWMSVRDWGRGQCVGSDH
jgi:hypothetical protein